MQKIYQLLSHGILEIGSRAKANPQSLGFQRFAAGIANKDYPALTPWLWNQTYVELGMWPRNIRLCGNPDQIAAIFETFKADQSYIGGDVGVGFKDHAWRFMDNLDPLARAMQAINVVVRFANGLKGFNTDGLGFAQSLLEVIRPTSANLEGKKIIVLGGGGTANSIGFVLASMGAAVVILNRTVSKAEDLANRINSYFSKTVARFGSRGKIAEEAVDADAVVSALDDPQSPLDKYSALGSIDLPATDYNIGMNVHSARAVMLKMPRQVVIADIMLRNQDTATISEAKLAGFTTLDGKPMVLYQAVEAFWLVNQKELESKGVAKARVADVMRQAMTAYRP